MATGTIERTPQVSTPAQPYRTRRRFLFAVLAVVVVGTAVAIAVRPEAPILATDGVGQISLVDPQTGEARYSVTNAVRAPNGSSIYRAEAGDDSTVIELIDPDSGAMVTSTEVGGRLEIRAVSPLGGAVALMGPRPDTADLYVPEPREYTSINVVWSDGRQPQNYTLKGNFEPETFLHRRVDPLLARVLPTDFPRPLFRPPARSRHP